MKVDSNIKNIQDCVIKINELLLVIESNLCDLADDIKEEDLCSQHNITQ